MNKPLAPGLSQSEIALDRDPIDVCAALRRPGQVTAYLDGSGFDDGWTVGPLVAIEPHEIALAHRAGDSGPTGKLDALERLVAARREAGGSAETGLLVILSYDFLAPGLRPAGGGAGLPTISVLAVDRSLRFHRPGHALLSIRGPLGRAAADAGPTAERVQGLLEAAAGPTLPGATCQGRPQTSLPREAYLRAVERVRRHIALGDIYQANLCQQFSVGYRGDPLALSGRLGRKLPAPCAAYVETAGFALVSASPEIFLRADPAGNIETVPIKGTRPRGATPELDRAAASELSASPKDRAELLMIVDLERNDLGRVCRTGSIRVADLAELRSYTSVHHLVARVLGRLRPATGVRRLIQASFPGGSITGAPKIRAMEILDTLEPVGRNFFTGSLFWLGDDGSLDSSILIRSLVFTGERVMLGAGGGVVADSDPVQEWEESNHKARALTEALGFDPQEAR